MKLTDAQKAKAQPDEKGKFQSFFTAQPVYQIECSCGWSGQSTSKACPNCEANDACSDSSEVKAGGE